MILIAGQIVMECQLPEEAMPSIAAAFMVVGQDDDPQVFSDLLGMTPDVSGRRGERKPSHTLGKSYVVKESFWEVRTEQIKHSFAVEDYVEATLSRVAPIQPKLATLPSSYIKRVSIHVAMTPGSSFPGFHLTPGLIARLAGLGVEFEVDIT